jgi:regulator of cell morphogenesis and NO signaling
MSFSDSSHPSSVIDEHATVNEILARYPATGVVFNAYGVDTCCGGEMPLGDAAIHARADRDALFAALEAAAGASSGSTRQGAA